MRSKTIIILIFAIFLIGSCSKKRIPTNPIAANTETVTATQSITQTSTNTLSYSSTHTPTLNSTETSTEIITNTNTQTETITNTFSNTPTYTDTSTHTSTLTQTRTPTFTATPLPKTFGGAGDDKAYCIRQTSDGGYIIAGETNSFGLGQDVYLVKISGTGAFEWHKTFGGSSGDYGKSVQQTSDGGYIIAGYTGSFGGLGEAYVIKADSSGNCVWARTYGLGISYDEANSIYELTGGGYIVAGSGYSSSINEDVLLVKIDSTGNTSPSGWIRWVGGSDTEEGRSVMETTDGGYIVSGRSFSYNSNGAMYLLKDGPGSWYRTYGGLEVNGDAGFSAIQTTDGGYAIIGHTYSYAAGAGSADSDVFLVKTDASGNLQWNPVWYKIFGGSGADGGKDLQQTIDSGYIIAGYTGSFGVGGYGAYLIKTDSAGDQTWYKAFGGINDDYFNSVRQTTDGGYIAVGYTNSYGAGGYDFYVVKTDSSGNRIW